MITLRARSSATAAVVAALVLSLPSAWAQAPPPPGAPPAPPVAPSATPAPPSTPSIPADPNTATSTPVPSAVAESTPIRLSFTNGDVSFWRPGADDWAPARENTPLAPGDMLYTGPGGNLEVQFGPKAYLRATDGAQLGIDNQEPGFLQVRLTAGTLAVDLRQLPSGSTVEVDTPTSALTITRAGLYRVDVSDDATTYRAHRGGGAVVTPEGGTATPLAADQQAVVAASNPAAVAVGPAPALTAWDQWNQQRGDYLVRYGEARNVSAGVYGVDSLAQHGTWQNVDTYGQVWTPSSVPANWSPYSTGRWMWDPRFGWTWLDDMPWGWAPYHYGRWVFVANRWGWAPGPIVARPVYAPALVVFLGGGPRPVCWAPLGWGEPVIPWWGRRGFVGVPYWGGWGGPRVVNNVVVNRHTPVNVTNITVYKNVSVTNAVVGVPAGRFGHGPTQVTRLNTTEVRELRPVHGAPQMRPVPASLVPASGPAPKPPASPRERPVVATRPPFDQTPTLRSQGLAPSAPSGAPPTTARIVPPPSDRPGQPPRPGNVPQNGGPRHGTNAPSAGQPPQPGNTPPNSAPRLGSNQPDAGQPPRPGNAMPPQQRVGPPPNPPQDGRPPAPQSPPSTAQRQRDASPPANPNAAPDANVRRGPNAPPQDTRGDRGPGHGRGGPQDRGDWSGRNNQGDRNDRR